ncbi:MAG: hypothetical protein MHM6MM_009343, partial [Cercozoa sp. M6MM]
MLRHGMRNGARHVARLRRVRIEQCRALVKTQVRWLSTESSVKDGAVLPADLDAMSSKREDLDEEEEDDLSVSRHMNQNETGDSRKNHTFVARVISEDELARLDDDEDDRYVHADPEVEARQHELREFARERERRRQQLYLDKKKQKRNKHLRQRELGLRKRDRILRAQREAEKAQVYLANIDPSMSQEIE